MEGEGQTGSLGWARTPGGTWNDWPGDLLHSTGNSTQYSVISYESEAKELEQECVRVWLSHFAV